MLTIAPNPPDGSRQDGAVLPVTRVRIVGPSMAPTMLNDEWWVVRRTSALRPGDVALLVHPGRPDLLIVKRVVRRETGGWWVLGDNPAASDDSRGFGVVPDANVLGRLWWRYRPIRRASAH
jgi:nickel-type superoxide dismutase maturation protease